MPITAMGRHKALQSADIFRTRSKILCSRGGTRRKSAPQKKYRSVSYPSRPLFVLASPVATFTQWLGRLSHRLGNSKSIEYFLDVFVVVSQYNSKKSSRRSESSTLECIPKHCIHGKCTLCNQSRSRSSAFGRHFLCLGPGGHVYRECLGPLCLRHLAWTAQWGLQCVHIAAHATQALDHGRFESHRICSASRCLEFVSRICRVENEIVDSIVQTQFTHRNGIQTIFGSRQYSVWIFQAQWNFSESRYGVECLFHLNISKVFFFGKTFCFSHDIDVLTKTQWLGQ